jgi:hypothetical protein
MPSDASPPATTDNPWLHAFISARWDEIILAQILVKRTATGFELRHIADVSESNLKPARPSDAHKIANFTSTGEFRPLKSTPDLQRGWIIRASSPAELAEALDHFYPNGLADRHALTQAPPPITNYRPFTARQTGMYRITTMLSDADVARIIKNLCTKNCLKQRLWTVGDHPTDSPSKKSAIPCLEPCAILLEAARKEVRTLQDSERRAG